MTAQHTPDERAQFVQLGRPDAEARRIQSLAAANYAAHAADPTRTPEQRADAADAAGVASAHLHSPTMRAKNAEARRARGAGGQQ